MHQPRLYTVHLGVGGKEEEALSYYNGLKEEEEERKKTGFGLDFTVVIQQLATTASHKANVVPIKSAVYSYITNTCYSTLTHLSNCLII